jgi:aldose 1-epimerase
MTIPRGSRAILGPALVFALFMSNYVSDSKAQIRPEAFHRIVGDSQVDLYTLKNSNGLEAKITNYGGIVVSLLVPDKNGKLTDVVLGYDDLCDYLAYTPYFGCIVGRYGNRIANAKFTLGGVDYHLVANNGPNSLHGGRKGFDKVVWKAEG